MFQLKLASQISIDSVIVLTLAITLIKVVTLAQDDVYSEDQRESGVSSLFGQVAKTVIYGSAVLARYNNRLLCPLLKYETEKDNDEQPTLFVFNNNLSKEQAYRIYSDDDITPAMIDEANFDPRQMTIIFVHGWLGGIHNEVWLKEAKNAALESSKHRNWLPEASDFLRSYRGNSTFRPNVIIVEWGNFAMGSLYVATQNSVKVSKRLGRLLSHLAVVGKLRPDLMHCLGHSIGAHICGQAARLAFPIESRSYYENVNSPEKRFGRITGLDPGGFCYELGIKNETSYQGLRPSDALLVDAYYSNRSPFGNKYQVAQYNVRVNNGFFQRPCSVWHNPDVATEYFKAAVRFAYGNIGNNDILSCDHYFATRFAHQLPPRTCSYVAYQCDSYRNFLRGKCGLCDSPSQCYPMSFEYQMANPSVEHAAKHLREHSSYFNQNFDKSRQPLGGVIYERRLSYFLRISNEEPYCSMVFRVRVVLDTVVVNLRSFRADWLRLRFIGPAKRMLHIKDTYRNGREVSSLGVYGPWLTTATNETEASKNGVDERTLTALFELNTKKLTSLMQDGDLLEAPIEEITVDYDNGLSRRQVSLSNPIEYIYLDYLSSTDTKIRSKFSRLFTRHNFTVIYKHLE